MGKNVGISGVAVAFTGLGLWFVYAAVQDMDPVSGLGVLLRGDKPPSRTPGDPYRFTAGNVADTVGGKIAELTAPVGREETTVVGGIRVHKSLASNLQAMLAAAKADGMTGITGGGWRSNLDQRATRLANGYTSDSQPSGSGGRTPTAIPGHSMHERGLAIDFSQNGQLLKKSTPFFGWLEKHAATYGLKNLPSEPWHWSTTGT